MVNAYVISDPTNPENEGKVKVIRYGKELAKIIQSAIDGDDASEFGAEKVFDVANGSTLRIKCEPRTGNAGNRLSVTYSSSKFLSTSKLELNDNQLRAIYEGVHDLEKFNKAKTSAELQRGLDQHFFCIEDVTTEEAVDEDTVPEPVKQVSTKKDPINEIFQGVDEAKVPAEDDTDAKLKELLAGL